MPTPERLDTGHHDVRCSFCGRHNEQVHMVAREDLRICQVCVARCAEIIDADIGVESPPGGWTGRWPLKPPPT